MKSRKLLLSLAVFFLVGAFVPTKASPIMSTEGEGDSEQPEARGWVSVGPNNISGRVRTIVFDKFNDGVMFAGSAGGGLFISVNNGNNWREIDFSNGESYAVSAIAQGNDGAIYVGTGEGFYEPIFAAQSNRKTGLMGNGVYKITLGNSNWAEGLGTDEEKYAYVLENFNSVVINGTQPEKYDLGHEFAFVNDLAFINDKLYIATMYGGLKIWNGSTLSDAKINNNVSVNVTDIKVNNSGKIAVAFDGGQGFEVALSTSDSTFAPINFSTKGGDERYGRIELAYAIKNNNMLYALVSDYSGYLQGVYKVDVDAANAQFGNKMISNSVYLGNSMNEAMAIAVNDLEQEYIYIASDDMQRLFDANGTDVFYSEKQTYYSAARISGSYVAPGIHSILFKENPQTAEDSVNIYLATDAGVYQFSKDMTQNYTWQPINKGLHSSQYYNVAAGPDGSIMGAAQSNAITYIATPSLDGQKSADIVWSPNSLGYTNFDIQTDRDNVPYDFRIESQTGSNVAGSAIYRSKPNIRKPFILMRPYNGLTRTYSDGNDYTEINDQTWHFGQGDNKLMSQQLVLNMIAAPFIAPMAYWESFNGDTKDSVEVKLVATDQNNSISATRIIRGEEQFRLIAGTELRDGDKILVESNSLDYPFFYELTEERFGATDGVLDLVFEGDTTFLVPSPIKSRLFVATANGVFVCNEIMNFSKTYDNSKNGLPWVRVYNVNGGVGDANALYTNPVHTLNVSPDGNTMLLAVDHLQDGTTDLIRVSGFNADSINLSAVGSGGFNASYTDARKFKTDTIGTYNRSISSIAFEADSDVAFITFSGLNGAEANIKKVSGLNGDLASIQVVDMNMSDDNRKPVFSMLLDAFSQKAYIGTDDGLYSTSNRNASNIEWTKVAEVPNVPVYDLYQQTTNLPQISYTTYLSNNATENVFEGTQYVGAVYAATYGKGLFMYRDELQDGLEPINVGLDDVVMDTKVQMNLFPNPAANTTVLNYSLATSSNVVMNIYDINGRLVSSLDKGRQSSGAHNQVIDVRSMQEGIYMIQLITNNAVSTAKLIVK
ncbi:MAG: T9SS type A sorting domain-containing protein [Bacteroidales bacterium]|nr:T9SS type A sorting domain-containing protein [Bacteroidales bacterium]